MKKMNKKGFSLIELIVVMAVMGILVLIAAPRYLGYTKDANVTAMQADAKTLSNAALQYSIAHDDAWPVVTDASGIVKVTLTDDADAVDTFDAVVKAYAGAKGLDLAVAADKTAAETAVAALTVGTFDPAKLSNLVKNTKNPAGNYYLVTDGVLAGEVFYNAILVGSNGASNNGVFTDIVE